MRSMYSATPTIRACTKHEENKDLPLNSRVAMRPRKRKRRYRGFAKDIAKMFSLFGLVNLVMAQGDCFRFLPVTRPDSM